jgi:hypothetical protein
MTEAIDYELNSSPVFAPWGPVTLLVGVEEQLDGRVRAYLGARWKRLYLLLDAAEAEPFRRAWATGQHIWMRPVPPAELLHHDE